MPKIIKDGVVYGSAPNDSTWEGTQAQYDAIPTPDPNVTYFITDGVVNPLPATNVSYNHTSSGLSATTVQGAIDEVVSDLKGSGAPLFKITNFASSTITVPANGAISIPANTMNYTIPTGYTPIGICSWYVASNDIFARSLDTSATGSSSFCVLRNVSSTAYSGAFQAKVVFAKTTYI